MEKCFSISHCGSFSKKEITKLLESSFRKICCSDTTSSVCYREQRKWEQLKKQRLVAEPVLSCSPQRHNSRGGC